ncbi:hypothetical protein LCGC14_0677030 [marine sediment metagenome]|uniref:Uncharacterized protein n=1 Tax=marine sediment metagenome TaxID=412755 RepID=A0A0F9QU95_9ZZZZ
MKRILISVVGMPPEQLLQIQDELNDEKNEQVYWLFDKLVEVNYADVEDYDN